MGWLAISIVHRHAPQTEQLTLVVLRNNFRTVRSNFSHPSELAQHRGHGKGTGGFKNGKHQRLDSTKLEIGEGVSQGLQLRQINCGTIHLRPAPLVWPTKAMIERSGINHIIAFEDSQTVESERFLSVQTFPKLRLGSQRSLRAMQRWLEN